MVASTNRFSTILDVRAQAVGRLSFTGELKLLGVSSHEESLACHNLDAKRFGDLADRVLYRCGDFDETDAAYPDSEVLVKLGIDVIALAKCLEANCITSDQIGKLVVSVQDEHLSVDDFDTAVSILSMRTPRRRDLTVDELDFGTMRDFGVDTDEVDECLHVGGVTPNQVAMLTASLEAGRLEPADFNTAMLVLQEDAVRN